MRCQVCIIGGGPAGLLLARILGRAGIDAIVLERKSRDYVLSRIRAGILEWSTCEVLRQAGVGARMDREGLVHDGCAIASNGRDFRIDFNRLIGRQVMAYGQTEITHDLYDALDADGTRVITEAEGVTPHGLDTDSPCVFYTGPDGIEHRVDCDYVAGCDGFHGVSRQQIPKTVLKEFERVYPFGWLGVMSETPPANPEVLYSNTERGFALCSMRSTHLSRYYIQVPLTDTVDDWPDDAFWDELRRRLPARIAERMVIGPSIEKSIAPLRSYVAEPLRWGRLFLAGDAAHIVPPTGAKGLNLAVSDVTYLSRALIAKIKDGEDEGIDTYSQTALARIWKAERFSWWMTQMLHDFGDAEGFGQRIREAELAYLESSEYAQLAMAENYAGLEI